MVNKTLLIISVAIVIVTVFLFVPLPQSMPASPTSQVPAEFGDTSVDEMIVVQEPVSMFCQIYRTIPSCQR